MQLGTDRGRGVIRVWADSTACNLAVRHRVAPEHVLPQLHVYAWIWLLLLALSDVLQSKHMRLAMFALH